MGRDIDGLDGKDGPPIVKDVCPKGTAIRFGSLRNVRRRGDECDDNVFGCMVNARRTTCYVLAKPLWNVLEVGMLLRKKKKTKEGRSTRVCDPG